MLSEFTNTKKILKEILSHNAGFQAWIPFYKETLDVNNKPDSLFYKKVYSPEFPYQVAENFYIKKD